MPPPLRILGIDTSLRSTGVAVIQSDGIRHQAVTYGRIHAPASWPRSQCLVQLQAQISEVITKEKPDTVAIEGIFFCKNVKTAFILGEARGTVICTCAAAGLPLYEYAPRKVKQGVVGRGAADKSQVAMMIKKLFGLSQVPQNDAADALAIAYCHATQLRTSSQTGEQKTL
ncbi:crossover junction endodeoxyribonuclease RuvC [Kiritimatiellaeota bacterium B1221]|nr:crossover junction endodeoxyribonuclease RuvC [Kiritimatiellaeota bacterium B1221]